MKKSEVKFNKNGKLAKLINKLHQLHNQKVEVGYFQAQGIHNPSQLHYTELMRIHEHGLGVYVRPVLGAEKSYNYSETIVGQMNSGTFKKTLNNWLCQYIKQKSFTKEHLADQYGMWASRTAGDIFGNPDVLRVTINETPLIDTGDLASAFSWKASWRGAIHTL